MFLPLGGRHTVSASGRHCLYFLISGGHSLHCSHASVVEKLTEKYPCWHSPHTVFDDSFPE
jgi:hypothetical protein